MKLSELVYKAACLVKPEKIERKKFRKGRSTAGLVAIPNKIRKRFSGATR